MKKFIKYFLIVSAIIFCILSLPFFIKTNYGKKSLNKFDVIIVLGNPAKKDCTPSEIMKSRVDEAIILYKKKLAKNIIFTGDSVANSCIEAETMAKYAKAQGIPNSAIIIEPKAQSTLQNAYYSVEIMKKRKYKTAAIVTNQFHIKRASLIFKKYPIQYRMFAAPLPKTISLFQKIKMNYRENLIIILRHFL
jgi:uncharacterized SAM-binding protein YcdF (DUF218 family)